MKKVAVLLVLCVGLISCGAGQAAKKDSAVPDAKPTPHHIKLKWADRENARQAKFEYDRATLVLKALQNDIAVGYSTDQHYVYDIDFEKGELIPIATVTPQPVTVQVTATPTVVPSPKPHK